MLSGVDERLGAGLPVLSNSGGRVHAAHRARSLQLRVQLRLDALPRGRGTNRIPF